MAITVHNLRTKVMPAGDERHVYVGRALPRRGLKGSPLANPYRMDGESDRARVIELYRAWLADAPNRAGSAAAELGRLAALARTGDLHLWCWCAPADCHADVIRERIAWFAMLADAELSAGRVDPVPERSAE